VVAVFTHGPTSVTRRRRHAAALPEKTKTEGKKYLIENTLRDNCQRKLGHGQSYQKGVGGAAGKGGDIAGGGKLGAGEDPSKIAEGGSTQDGTCRMSQRPA